MGPQQNPPVKSESTLDPCSQTSSQYRSKPDQNQQAEQQHINLNTDFYNVSTRTRVGFNRVRTSHRNSPIFPQRSAVPVSSLGGPPRGRGPMLTSLVLLLTS